LHLGISERKVRVDIKVEVLKFQTFLSFNHYALQITTCKNEMCRYCNSNHVIKNKWKIHCFIHEKWMAKAVKIEHNVTTSRIHDLRAINAVRIAFEESVNYLSSKLLNVIFLDKQNTPCHT